MVTLFTLIPIKSRFFSHSVFNLNLNIYFSSANFFIFHSATCTHNILQFHMLGGWFNFRFTVIAFIPFWPHTLCCFLNAYLKFSFRSCLESCALNFFPGSFCSVAPQAPLLSNDYLLVCPWSFYNARARHYCPIMKILQHFWNAGCVFSTRLWVTFTWLWIECHKIFRKLMMRKPRGKERRELSTSVSVFELYNVILHSVMDSLTSQQKKICIVVMALNIYDTRWNLNVHGFCRDCLVASHTNYHRL